MPFENVNWGILGQRMGLGALLGLAVGYTAKKALKLVLILGGILLLVLLALQSFDVITINWHVVEEGYSQAFQDGSIMGMLSNWAEHLDTLIPVAGSFLVGFFIGFRLG